VKYVIVQESTKDDGIQLFMLDHRRCGYWWGYKLENVKTFDFKEQAEQVKNRLRYNHPRVVSLTTAEMLERKNRQHKQQDDVEDEDQSWDAHKDSF
jgi:hypothetical protein